MKPLSYLGHLSTKIEKFQVPITSKISPFNVRLPFRVQLSIVTFSHLQNKKIVNLYRTTNLTEDLYTVVHLIQKNSLLFSYDYSRYLYYYARLMSYLHINPRLKCYEQKDLVWSDTSNH
jgi:hypothetical protein